MGKLRRAAIVGAVLATVAGVTVGVATVATAATAVAQAQQNHYYILIGGTCDTESANFPDLQGGIRVPVHYPASAPPLCGETTYDQSVAKGHANANAELERVYRQDPAGEFTVVGYSQGAHVANLVLNDVADRKIGVPAGQVSAKLYADPMQPETGIGAVVPAGVGTPPPFPMTSPGPGRTDFGGIRFIRYCIETDGVCHFTTPEAAGGYFAQHPCYPRHTMPATIADGAYGNQTRWLPRVNCRPPYPAP